jgi:hypothetical protein
MSMEQVGTFLTIFGVLTMAGGGIWFLFTAFSESALWGLGCIFVPFVSLIFLILHWEKAAQPFGVQILGIVLVVTGTMIQAH